MRILLGLIIAILPLALSAAAPTPARGTAKRPAKRAAAKKPASHTASKGTAHAAAKRPVAATVAQKTATGASAKRPITVVAKRKAAARKPRKLSAAILPSTPPNLPPLPDFASPLAEVRAKDLHSEFNDHRRGHRHHAIDLMSPRGTPVMAVTDGVINKLYRSKTGGISVYLFDTSQEFCFFYGHLDHYAEGLHEGQEVHKGEVIAYVGYTGNAKRNAPHLHFAVSLTGPQRKWSGGTPFDPYPMLVTAAPAVVPGPGTTGSTPPEPAAIGAPEGGDIQTSFGVSAGDTTAP